MLVDGPIIDPYGLYSEETLRILSIIMLIIIGIITIHLITLIIETAKLLIQTIIELIRELKKKKQSKHDNEKTKD